MSAGGTLGICGVANDLAVAQAELEGGDCGEEEEEERMTHEEAHTLMDGSPETAAMAAAFNRRSMELHKTLCAELDAIHKEIRRLRRKEETLRRRSEKNLDDRLVRSITKWLNAAEKKKAKMLTSSPAPQTPSESPQEPPSSSQD